ncbi:helix-turn-helix domain-containing protein [Amorphus sp. 3PC139-8]|uniref:helix-turn-helix domain-containing protein n=1 Tax=Amorphus sp. 3PC139-8 TaxID=2735676 RepID=UPI00345C99DA
MAYANEEIIEALKSAREAKGLSQRALSARTGVPQSHISKIESGNADIRLSSLIELARALELDLKLIPRKAVPAVDSVVRSTAPKAGPVHKDLTRELNQSLKAVNDLRAIHPDLSALRTLQENLQLFSRTGSLNVNAARLHEITKPLRDIQKLTQQQKAINNVPTLPARTLKELDELANASRALRNFAVHARAAEPGTPRPAYRLDDDDDHDDGHHADDRAGHDRGENHDG